MNGRSSQSRSFITCSSVAGSTLIFSLLQSRAFSHATFLAAVFEFFSVFTT